MLLQINLLRNLFVSGLAFTKIELSKDAAALNINSSFQNEL